MPSTFQTDDPADALIDRLYNLYDRLYDMAVSPDITIDSRNIIVATLEKEVETTKDTLTYITQQSEAMTDESVHVINELRLHQMQRSRH